MSKIRGQGPTSWARQYGVATPQLQALQEAFHAGVAQGHWVSTFESVGRPMSQRPGALPGLKEALKRGKGGSGLIADLDAFTVERNLWAHGGGPHTKAEAAERAQTFLPVLERVLDKSTFLSDMPWILVSDIKPKRHASDFLVQSYRVMGDHPDFDLFEFTTTQPLAEDFIYLLTPHGPIDLTPLVVIRQCTTCHQPEVAYADRIDEKKGLALKTFDRGHLLFDSDLVEEVRHLVPVGDPGEGNRAG